MHEYFRIWSERKEGQEESLLESLLKELVKEERLKLERDEETSFVIVDAQSVKNTDTAKEKGYDAGWL